MDVEVTIKFCELWKSKKLVKEKQQKEKRVGLGAGGRGRKLNDYARRNHQKESSKIQKL